MKNKYLLFAICSFAIAPAAHAATPWWLQPTICKFNPTKCYTNMGAGFDTGMWDAGSNCWGMKLVCPDALTASPRDPQPVAKTVLMAGTGINADFDTDTFSSADGCYGTRRGSGAYAMVNGVQVKVWCHGILMNPTETLSNGEITSGAQPTCAQLAADGIVAIQNGNCFGKKYSTNDYFIECGAGELPTRIVQIRGASNFVTGTGSAGGVPVTQSAANSMFDAMISTSTGRRNASFNQ